MCVFVYVCVCVCVCVCVNHSVVCPILWDPMNCSPPGSSVHEILQARIWDWVAIPFSRESSQPRDWIRVSCIAGGFFTIWATREVPAYLSQFRSRVACQCFLNIHSFICYPFIHWSSKDILPGMVLGAGGISMPSFLSFWSLCFSEDKGEKNKYIHNTVL